ncbi:MAG: heavy-metal-associated domain-containing protein [Thermoplasmata archaeon]|jgi:copper chaperone|nr:heavy-metal-associated domain-containing protein [Candidatus Sysuiplasma jiujiangense]
MPQKATEMQERILVLKVKGMHCQGCSDSIARELNVSAGVKKTAIELTTGKVKIVFDPDETDEELIRNKIIGMGFDI